MQPITRLEYLNNLKNRDEEHGMSGELLIDDAIKFQKSDPNPTWDIEAIKINGCYGSVRATHSLKS